MRICSTCVLPESFPGIEFDAKGRCNHCRAQQGVTARSGGEQRLSELIAEHHGQADYDALVAFSGGKDSSYVLYLLRRRYDLRLLALTFDNGFIPETAWRNTRAVTEALGIDHLVFRPAFGLLRRLFAGAAQGDHFPPVALQRASAICTACMSLVKLTTWRESMLRRIPFVVYGWSPGQAPPAGALFRHNPEMLHLMEEAQLDPLRSILDEEVEQYRIPAHLRDDPERMPYHVNLFGLLPYDEAAATAALAELGWQRPPDTDPNSTNCQLNTLANLLHRKRYGYHPYAFELAQLVRQGYLAREEALARLEPEEDPARARAVAERLGIRLS